MSVTSCRTEESVRRPVQADGSIEIETTDGLKGLLKTIPSWRVRVWDSRGPGPVCTRIIDGELIH